MIQNKTQDLTVIILTFNEEIHLERCLNSIKNIAKRIVIIDSFSTDRTKEIALTYKADVFENHWNQNYANQLNWGLRNSSITTKWTMRLDADEYLTEDLEKEIAFVLSTSRSEINGFVIPRSVIFKKQLIKFGGWNKFFLLRIWKTGIGKSEERWMDEHIILNETPSLLKLKHKIIDENLNSIHWWTIKHNNYARREALDYLIEKYSLSLYEENFESNRSAKLKREIKNNFYNTLPLFIRAFVYFCFRYFIKLGFLDGKAGLIWHFLQGFWYRFLVDVNIYEIEKLTNKNSNLIKKYIQENWSK